MAVSITAALVTAGALGLWFSSTRPIAIGAIALLAFTFPWLVIPILLVSAAAFYRYRIRK